MTTTKKLAAAALAGLFSASVMAAVPAFANEHGGAAADAAKTEKSDGTEKHACKGHNSCKGQGADGKNECKGKGSCRTDGGAAPEAAPAAAPEATPESN